MCEQYRTKGRALFSSLTAYAHQHYTMCNNKSAVPEFTIFSMIVSLYNFQYWTHIVSCLIYYIRPFPKARSINKITCHLYPCGFLFGTNIIIASIIVLFDFMKFSHYCSSNSQFSHHI